MTNWVWVEILDELFVVHPQNHISTGKVVKAMVLNCLGFLSAPLYLFSEFFESKPVEHLLGEGIEAHHLNDDRIGRALDQLWEFGLSSLFVRLAMAAVSKFGISVEQTGPACAFPQKYTVLIFKSLKRSKYVT